MKVTLNWLKQYVEFDWSPGELSERLTMLGLEVEGVQKISGAFEGIVVAQVLTRDKHPNADKLSLCRVNDGQGERQIVCGADNFKAGDKVPLILPGASLPPKPGGPAPFMIKVGKIRGMESQGMLCSPLELGLPDPVDGLLILREDAKVGQPFAEYLGRGGGDTVYDLEVTPNRPDLNSVIGIAREIAAVTGNPLRIPAVNLAAALSSASPTSPERDQDAAERVPAASDLVAVRIEAPEFCPRYTARVVRGVNIGPSPDWLRSTLEKIGIRSINNVVDVTNYVMLEIGQPLHAFDYQLISCSRRGDEADAPGNPPAHVGGDKPTIIIRRAATGERFKTLDDLERTLTSDMLLITGGQQGIALAGVMGGANTEINDRTVDVLIESASFSPTNIRRTSKALGLRSESSYRFERGADIGICDWASRRCAQLILETAGGQLAEGVVDAYPTPAEPRQITLRHRKVNELLGITLRPEEMEYYLCQLGLKALNRKARPVEHDRPVEAVTFQIPTWRVDLKREADLIEEIERLHGLEKIPATPPRGAIGTNAFDAIHDQIADVRRLLCGLGLNEAQGQTLVSGVEDRGPGTALVALANPLSADMDVLRPSLLPGLLNVLRHNVTRKHYDVALFEVGRVFRCAGLHAGAASGTADGAEQESRAPVEERRVAIALTGRRGAQFWSGNDRDVKFDIFDAKGLIEELLEQCGIRGPSYSRRADSAGLFLESAMIHLGKQPFGEVGQLLPTLAKQYDLRDPVLLAELNLDLLLARHVAGRSFKPLPPFPSIRRDVAMLVPEATTHDAVLQAVKQAAPAHLEAVELFDVFRGQHVPEGRKSLAYAFTYRSADKTLTDAEVNAAHAKVVEAFTAQLQATVRE